MGSKAQAIVRGLQKHVETAACPDGLALFVLLFREVLFVCGWLSWCVLMKVMSWGGRFLAVLGPVLSGPLWLGWVRAGLVRVSNPHTAS
jgi:hypothetical protein